MPDPNQVDDAHVLRVLHEFVRPAVTGPSAPLDEIAAHHVHGEPISYDDAVAAAYEPFAIGDTWGPAWDTTWFRFRGTIPPEWAGEEVVLRFEIGGAGDTGFGAEALVWDHGRPMQGLSPNHREYRLTRSAEGGSTGELYVEAAANPRATWGLPEWPLLLPEPDGAPQFTLARAELRIVQRELRAFWEDARLLSELLTYLPPDDPRASQVRAALVDACAAIDLDDVAGTVAHAQPALKAALGVPARSGGHRVSAVGHAHLDTAWLWPLRETVRKCARTFATAVSLMDEYPEYRFACSQAVHLAWTKEHYPDLFERIRSKVATGQFEPTGSMWVEPDCNLPGGESLVRQLVYGKRFFLDEFGIETRDAWLPDVFGFTAALPQIFRRAGVEWFLTQKLSWNQYNVMPHHSFQWEGIDGSRVFAHFPPADTYGGNMTVDELRTGVDRFLDHGIASRSLYPFGHGDGGGGPTAEMLEAARRMRDLDGVPPVVIEGPRAFFEAAAGEAADWPVWVGELYLELHRGTYTTHADVKLGNRQGELALREAELWAATVLPAAEYPGTELEDSWKTLLLHQFHDILPGSGIHWVYEDSARDHAAVLDDATDVVDRATTALVDTVDTTGHVQPVVVLNATAHDRTGLLEIDGQAVALVDVPACGYAVHDLASPLSERETPALSAGADHLENERLRIALDGDGLLTSVYDKLAGREVLAPGARANVFQLHPDRPNFFDAWDVDRFAFDTVEELTALDSIEVVESSPLRVALRVTRSFGSSRVMQHISLATGSNRIDFATEVDWHESHRFLKVAFPVAVHSPRATYEIQFGHLERPTHENTSWDLARFEVSAQQWADLSEGDYGVALLNDCKYGYDVRGNVLRLSLLRAPTWPDPVADRGHHRFTYALLPHTGDFRTGGVIEAARELNSPLWFVPAGAHTGDRPARASLVRVDRAGVDVVAVKRADRAPGVIVRLAEVWGRRTPMRLELRDGVRAAFRTDLLERDLEPVVVEGGAVELDLLPFELVTLRLER